MKVIEKIEIKNFRSFGNREGDKIEVAQISDLNVISGANDSGKSNILRALNLFFNGNTDLNEVFNFHKDYFKKDEQKKDNLDKIGQIVTIKISFFNEKNRNKNRNTQGTWLPERFRVARKWKRGSAIYTQETGVETAFRKEKGGYEKTKDFYEVRNDGKRILKPRVQANLSTQLSNFLTSIQYHYIPAIKDRLYFSHLYGELQQTLLKEAKSDVDTTKTNFEKAIQTSTNDLMLEFKNVVAQKTLDISPVFELPNLINLFRTLNVQTGQVNLQSRGDGIQAKLIPEILNFISVKEKGLTSSKIKKGEKAKDYFIWGFEEPENSYEYRNAQLLADRFKEVFSNNAQIFLTTHSFNFLSIEGENVSTYRVWRDGSISGSRVITLKKDSNGQYTFEGDYFKNDIDRLNEELGFIYLNKDLEKVFLRNEQLRQELEGKISQLENEERILFVEDKYCQLYKIAWLKINEIEFNRAAVDDAFRKNAKFIIQGLESASSVSGFLRANNIDMWKGKKIIGLFDFDNKGTEEFYYLKKGNNWSEEIKGDKFTCLYKQRNQHPCFYGMLLPVPESLKHLADMSHENFANYIEVENLLPIEFLQKHDFVDEKSIAGIPYHKCRKDVKDKVWKKAIDLQKSDFNNFAPLYNTVSRLLGIS